MTTAAEEKRERQGFLYLYMYSAHRWTQHRLDIVFVLGFYTHIGIGI